MRRITCILGAAVLAGALPYLAHAEKVDTPPEGLRKTATHVVIGKVRHIYTRSAAKGKWAYTHYVAEVVVEKSEKGDLKAGGLVYARYWRRQWRARNAPPPSTAGYRGLPKEGERLRIYLARNAYDGFGKTNDGGFNVVAANGFERIK